MPKVTCALALASATFTFAIAASNYAFASANSTELSSSISGRVEAVFTYRAQGKTY